MYKRKFSLVRSQTGVTANLLVSNIDDKKTVSQSQPILKGSDYILNRFLTSQQTNSSDQTAIPEIQDDFVDSTSTLPCLTFGESDPSFAENSFQDHEELTSNKKLKYTISNVESKNGSSKKSGYTKDRMFLIKASGEEITLSQQILSQVPRGLTHKEKLLWLQERRGVGTYVECTKCEKWRYLPDVKEPINVAENWVCSMNSDIKWANCVVPEQRASLSIELDLILVKFTAGSLVWAKMEGWPWWPAMVDDDPDTEQYYWLNEKHEATDYNVTFFDDMVSRGWLKLSEIKPFRTGNEHKLVNKKYKDRLIRGRARALNALKMDIKERLRTYSFLTLYKGPINDPIDPPISESDSDSDFNTIFTATNKSSNLEA